MKFRICTDVSSRALVAAILVSMTALLSANVAAAQDEKEQQQLISGIYARTKTAKTLNDFTTVIELCEKARTYKLSKPNYEYLNRLEAWAYNKRGESNADKAASLTESGDLKQAEELDAVALKDFSKAVEFDPKRWKAVHNRGVSYAMVGKYEEAIGDFTRTLELNPKYINGWFNRAEIRYEIGEYGKAIGDYDRAIELDPKDVGAYTSRGHSFFQLRRIEEAIRDYSKVLQLAPGNADAYVNRGDAYRARGQWDVAAADYRKAVAIDNNSGRAYQSAAWLMATCPDERF
ncbi:MAG: tetratricopeptide repeat protein, partial [Pirellulaceae bacterium]|nr:tetratricopeptide repeat protein [Pirellulaceae bacterium]